MSISQQPSRVRALRLFGISFLAAFSGAIMPGPVLVASIEQTTQQGMKAMLGIMTGHALLEFVLLIFLMLGLHTVIVRPRVRASVAIIGGVAMIYMGTDMAINAFRVQVDLSRTGQGAYSWGGLMLAGVLLSLANPYFTGWWATIGTGQLARLAPQNVREYASFYLGHEAGDYVWYTFVGFLIVTGRRWLSGPIYQGTIIVCALALAALGVYFLYSTVKILKQSAQASA